MNVSSAFCLFCLEDWMGSGQSIHEPDPAGRLNLAPRACAAPSSHTEQGRVQFSPAGESGLTQPNREEGALTWPCGGKEVWSGHMCPWV